MPVFELSEEAVLDIPRAALSEADALALYRDRRFNLEFPNPANCQQYRLRSSGWVGHMPISDTTLVRVTPKVPVASVFRMLEVAYNLSSFAFLDGDTEVATLDELYSSLASVLAQRVLDRARKGLFRAYVPRADDLPYVRGRIDPRDNLHNVLSGTPRVRCRFRELTADLEDNQILLWALYTASRLELRETVRQQVRKAYRALAGSVSVVPKLSADCVGRYYHRLNDDYAPLHGLCRFLLEHTGPSVHHGDRRFIPFELNMPRLFEAFVAQWLRQHLPPHLRVRAQHHVRLKGDGDLSFRIDLVLLDRLTGAPLAVLDTKYKAADKPSEADVQQVVAYAVELGASSAFLVYPAATVEPVTVHVGPVSVHSLVFDLEADDETAGGAFLNDLVSV